jgi:membrane fusion protein
MAESALFRQEAIDAKQDHYLGSIRIARNPSLAFGTAIALLLGAALIAYSIVGQVTRRAKVAGLLLPPRGSLQVSSTAAGVVADITVVEGQRVVKGEPLATVDSDKTIGTGNLGALVAQTIETKKAALSIERSNRELYARDREQGLADRIRSVEAELREAEGETNLLGQRIALAQKTVQRFTALAKEGFVADVQAQQKQEELLDLGTRYSANARNRTALERDLIALRDERSAAISQSRVELAQFDRARSQLQQEEAENSGRGQTILVSPTTGVVTVVNVHRGQSVSPSQTVATVVPIDDQSQSAELQAQLYAPSRTAGFVQSGQRVWLRYAAFPYQKFGMQSGEVLRVSDTPVSPQDLPSGQANALLSATQSNEPLYRIDVRLDRQDVLAYGQAHALKVGMAVEGDVILDRRAVWEWVLEPVLAASRALATLNGPPGVHRGTYTR